jgi:hypothetical protein
MPARWPAPLGLMDTMAIRGYQPCCNVLRHYSQVKGLCRDFRAGEMAGLPNRVSIAVSVPIAASILCMEPQAQLAGKKW